MYTVQHLALIVEHSPLKEEAAIRSEWRDLFTVGQLLTEQRELQEARRVAYQARNVYCVVRIVESLPGGEQRVIV